MKLRNLLSIFFTLVWAVGTYFVLNDLEGSGLQKRSVANISREKTKNQILVFRKNIKPYITKAPAPNFFDIRSEKSGLEIGKLREFFLKRRQAFGISLASEEFQLVLYSVRKMSNGRISVRFNQVQQRELAGQTYVIPVSGGSLVVILRDGAVDRVNTSLKSIRKKNFSFSKPGFDLSNLSETELNVLSDQMSRSKNKKMIADYFNKVALLSGNENSFEIEDFLKLTAKKQQEELVNIFGKLNRQGTNRILINLARTEGLSLVQYSLEKEWMYTVRQPFGLDIEFDIEIPKNEDAKLSVKNLRLSSYDSEITLSVSPHFPIEVGKIAIDLDESGHLQKKPGIHMNPVDLITAQNFKKLKEYYDYKYSWNGLTGMDSDKKGIHIHTQLEGRYLGSARWSATRELFLLGANGRGWVDKGKSLSILGHEYFHALITYSSGLVYRGQSGALNEHLADIHGVLFESDLRHNGKFDYTIGDEGIMEDFLVEELKTKNIKWAKDVGLTAFQIKKYKVGQAQLRNLYYPLASKHRQYIDYSEMLKEFPEDCEPSAANNNCGVHYSSGILNKAVSRIIEDLGVKKMRQIIFNTAIYRLSMDSNFKDYGLQLYEECNEQANEEELEIKVTESECDQIIRYFKQVGVRIESQQVGVADE